MALPAPNTAWPPKAMAPITAKYREYDAWYSGDLDKLYGVYKGDAKAVPHDRVSQHRGGVIGAVARMWWGRPRTNLLENNTDQDRLHIPLASDICEASADLVYAEAPTLSSQDKTVAKELDLLLERGLITRLAEGNEVGAALGDTYYRVSWDATMADRSFITTVSADAAWPEFRWGMLVAVTFSWVLRKNETVWLRHLERHETLGPEQTGVIYHGLYQGTQTSLGQPVPLTEHPSTEHLADPLTGVNAEGYISTESPGLAVVHAPNKTPQRLWRDHPIGAHLGRSDLAGVEPELDKLDMVWSSWMRDIRLAKARLIVPNFMLTGLGPGQGAIFDTDQDIYSSLNAPPREDGSMQITPQQFAIRVAEHQATVNDLTAVILRAAGYGPQTFGATGDTAQTATEVENRDQHSNRTRDRKIRAVEGELVKLIRKKLAIDAAKFGTGVDSEAEFELHFPETSQASPESLARTNQLLYTAQSASTLTRVKLQHPDWDDTACKEEAARILEEFSTSVPDPTSFRPGVDEETAPVTDEEQQETD